MEKKRKMSQDKFSAGDFIELTPKQLANMYIPKPYSGVSYTVNVNTTPKVVVDKLLDMLHEELLKCIDEMVETSDLAEAKQVIARVK